MHIGRQRVLDGAYQATPERFIRRHESATGPDRRVDQQAHDNRGGRSLRTDMGCLTGLDRLRSVIADAGNPRTTIDGAADSTRGF